MTDAIFFKFPLNSLKSISQLRNQKFEQILIFHENRIFTANLFQQDATSSIYLLTTKSFI